jgi:hypothetical protein
MRTTYPTYLISLVLIAVNLFKPPKYKFFPQGDRPNFEVHTKEKSTFYIVYFNFFLFLDRRQEVKVCELRGNKHCPHLIDFSWLRIGSRLLKFMNTIMNLGQFIDQLSNYNLLKKDPIPWTWL